LVCVYPDGTHISVSAKDETICMSEKNGKFYNFSRQTTYKVAEKMLSCSSIEEKISSLYSSCKKMQEVGLKARGQDR